MFHARIFAPGTHRFINRIITRRAKKLPKRSPEPGNRFIRQQNFRCSAKINLSTLFGAGLGRRVECANAFELIPEEIKSQRLIRPGREDIDQPAAHGEFTRLAHRAGTGISIRREIGR